MFDELHVDELGRLWLREFGWNEGQDTWQVAALRSGTIAKVVLPAGARILYASADSVLLLRKDEFDIEYVSLYELGS